MDARTKQIRRLRWRSVHRGTKEVDLLLGGFVERYIEDMDAECLNAFEAFLSYPDPQMHAWMIHEQDPPENLPAQLRAMIASFDYQPPSR